MPSRLAEPLRSGKPQTSLDLHRTIGLTASQADVAKSVDATDLDKKLSAHRETFDAELLKFGGTLQAGEQPMAIPSQA